LPFEIPSIVARDALPALLAVAFGLLAVLHWRALRSARRGVDVLAAETRQHAAVMRAMPDAVLSVDPDEHIVMFNPAAERLFGCRADEAIGRPISRFIPTDARARHHEHFAAFAQTGHALLNREMEVLRVDGARIPVEASVFRADVPTPTGPRQLFTVLLRDLSGRKAAREAMHRIQERYRQLVEQSPEAIWLAEDGCVVLVNPAAERLAGSTRAADLLGRDLLDFLPSLREPGPPAAAFGTVLPLGLSEQRLRRLDGTELDVEISAAAVPDHGGVAVQVLMRDIGMRKRLERLQQERERLMEQVLRIAQTVPGVIVEWVVQEDGRSGIPFASAMFESVFGLPSAQMVGDVSPIQGRIHPDDRPKLARALERSARDMAPCQQEFRYDHPHLGERWLEGRSMPRRGADGRLSWNAFVMDISDRMRVQQAATEHHARLQEAERIALVGHFSLDMAAGCWTLSDSMCELLGRPKGGVLSYQQGLEIVHADDRAGLEQHVRDVVLAARGPLDHEFRMLRLDTGEVRWVHGRGALQRDGRGRASRVFGTVQDITSQRRATEKLQRSREDLRRLSASLNTAREEERRHISRELHDELGQRLQAIKLEISALVQAPADPQGAGVELTERLRALLRSVDVTVAATRRIAADLRPAMLDDLGLGAAIDWLVRDWSARAGLEIHLDQEPLDDALTEAAATTVYRIVQEALTNVTRHAHARHAVVTLRRVGSELVTVVEDDGRGLAPGDTDKHHSHGLVGMRERAHNLGGSVTLGNANGGGCRVVVRLPLDRIDSHISHFEEPE
jgi:two-component system, NarL family, sensor histidine kinase UhpB